MTKKLVLGLVSAASIFSAPAFANPLKNMFSSGVKTFVGASVNSSNVGAKTTSEIHTLGGGITAGMDYEIGKNNLIVDLSLDMPVANHKVSNDIGYETLKSKYGISLGVKYAFNIFENAKGYAGVSLHNRKYTMKTNVYELNSLTTNNKTMMHIAAVLGMEAKVATKVGFFGELHYFLAGGKAMVEKGDKLNKGNMMKVGARYYY